MKLFGKAKQQKSIADFKNGARYIAESDAINAITGGTMDGCHKVSGVSNLSSLSINSASLSTNVNLSSIGSIGALRF